MSSRKFRRKSSCHHSCLEFRLPSHAQANCPTTMVGRPSLVELCGLRAGSLMGPVKCLQQQTTLLWLCAIRHVRRQKTGINFQTAVAETGPLTTECPTTARKCYWRLSSAVCIRQGTMVAEQSEVLGPQRSFRLGNGNCSRCKGLQVVFRSLQPDLHTARPEATQNVAIASPKTVFEVQIPLD